MKGDISQQSNVLKFFSWETTETLVVLQVVEIVVVVVVVEPRRGVLRSCCRLYIILTKRDEMTMRGGGVMGTSK